MANIYTELNAAAFENFLQSHGFQRVDTRTEIVYIRRHHRYQHLIVKVYTSLSPDASIARSCGSDAIRVVAIFDNGQRSFGVGKFPRVYRSAPHDLSFEDRQAYVFNKALERMRDAYARCNEWLKEQQNKR